jgi:DNA repair protein RAD7
MSGLETDDFQKIFAFMPLLVNVNLRFAGQMKDRVVEYMMERQVKLKHLQLDAANLVSDGCWRQFFITLGPQLEGLRLSNLDCSLDDETAEIMSRHCVNLRRLKLKQCWKLGDKGYAALADLSKLEHLSLDFLQEVQPTHVVNLVEKLGPNLRTLSLQSLPDADDKLLDAIHRRCPRLEKLRLTENGVCTDKGYVSLLSGWSNPPLKFVDLSSTRDVDNSNADGPQDPVGLASDGFAALMEHSGSRLEKLNISSCRHISRDAFEKVFSDGRAYPALKELDISFQTVVDDFLVASIFKCCPSLQKLIAFACFNINNVRVPTGVALIGGLRAQDSIIMEGTAEVF